MAGSNGSSTGTQLPDAWHTRKSPTLGNRVITSARSAGHGAPAPSSDAPREVFSPCAAAALYRRDALDDVGGFDERYFCYVEDVDLGFRLRLRGHGCLYVPDAVVHHVGSGTTGRGSDFTTYHGHRNLVWTFFKDMPGPLLALYLLPHLVLNLATIAWFATHGRARLILRTKWDALRGLPAVLELPVAHGEGKFVAASRAVRDVRIAAPLRSLSTLRPRSSDPTAASPRPAYPRP